MKKPLNEVQRKFLEYLRDNHQSLGFSVTLPEILQDDKYEYYRFEKIVEDWRYFIKENFDKMTHGAYIKKYNTTKPFNYLK